MKKMVQAFLQEIKAFFEFNEFSGQAATVGWGQI